MLIPYFYGTADFDRRRYVFMAVYATARLGNQPGNECHTSFASSLIASCVHELGIIILGSIANDWGYNNWVNNY